MALIVSELICLVGLFKCLGVDVRTPIQLFKDSKSAMQTANNTVFHERIKHIEIYCQLMREKVYQGLIHPEYVSTTKQEEDLMTKGFGRCQHYYLLSNLEVLIVFKKNSFKEGVKIIVEKG